MFMFAEDIMADLGVDREEAEKIILELGARIVQKGGMYIRGRVPTWVYNEMKSTGFTSAEGVPEPDRRKLTEKRLLSIDEFCFYSGLGEATARKLAKETGIEKRIGRRVLFDRVLFDRWCDNNAAAL